MERRSTRDDDRGSRDRDRGSRDSGGDRGGRDSGRDSGRDDSRSSRDSGRDRGGRDEGRSSRDSGRSGFSYARRTYEQTEKRANQGSKDFDSFLRDDIKTYKPHDGENTIRILPPTWDKPEHYGIELNVHYGIGPDEQAYLCSEKHGKGPCRICEARNDAQKAGEDEEYINSLKPTKRGLFYMIDRKNEADGVIAWASPWTIDTGITKVSVDRKSREILAIDDPEEGYDVEFDKRGKGVNTKYEGIAIARRSSPLGKAEWLDFVVDNPLPEILVFHDYEHIAKVFGGGSRRAAEGSDRGGDRDSRGRDSGRDDRSSRDRDDRGDRGSSRGDSDRDSRGARGSDRGSDRDRDDGRGRRGPALPTWAEVQKAEGEALDEIVKEHDLKLKPNDYDNDEDLRADICKELDLEEEVDTDDRMSRMRRR